MRITVDISMYPLDRDYKPKIKDFIRRLHKFAGIEIVTNQMSTQIRGEYDAVTAAVNDCVKQSMESGEKAVFITKSLNADLDIHHAPDIGHDPG